MFDAVLQHHGWSPDPEGLVLALDQTAPLDAAGVPYTRNHRLVRGLDYYTRTTF